MKRINLTNITIKKIENLTFGDYFVITDNNTDQVYFCFQNKLKEDWPDLVNNWESIKEAEIEFETNERGNKVTSLYFSKEGDILI